MRQGFVRTLWGVLDASSLNTKHALRRGKISFDIELYKYGKYNPPFIVFVFGEENYKILTDIGFNCFLVDKRPIVWDLATQCYRHKLEAFKLGAETFDEFVFLDWDVQAINPVPENFWDILRKKESIQAALRWYKKTIAPWRANKDENVPLCEKDNKQTVCASFVYFNNKQIPSEIIKYWEKMGEGWSEEAPMAKYMDDLSGGWKGKEYYWEHFEPDFFWLYRGSSFTKEKNLQKTYVFNHFSLAYTQELLKRIEKGRVFSWTKKKG